MQADASQTGGDLIAEEKDLTKLKLKKIKNAVAIPILDKQNGAPVAVLMVYNYDDALVPEENQRTLTDVASLLSSVMFNAESLQGMLADNDCLETQFNLVNDGVIMLDAELAVTKINKSAEILLNTASPAAVGKKVTEALGPANSHLMKPITQ